METLLNFHIEILAGLVIIKGCHSLIYGYFYNNNYDGNDLTDAFVNRRMNPSVEAVAANEYLRDICES